MAISKFPGWRTMTAAQRHNSKMDAIWEAAKGEPTRFNTSSRAPISAEHTAAIDSQTAAFVQARMMGRPVSFRYVDGTHETFNA